MSEPTNRQLHRTDDAQHIIDVIDAALATGRYCLGAPNPGQISIGIEMTVTINGVAERAASLDFDVVAQIVGDRDNLEERLASAMSSYDDVIIKFDSDDGSFTVEAQR
jgi:hypothetical protein